MSMQDLTDALAIVNANPGRGFFAGARPQTLITAAESALRATFPPTYRAFLQQLGAGSFGSFEIYGLIHGNFDDGRVPNGIWLTINQRNAGKIPQNFVIIGDSGDGGYYGIELCEKEEAPVVLFYPGHKADEHQRPEQDATDFGEYFSIGIREQL